MKVEMFGPQKSAMPLLFSNFDFLLIYKADLAGSRIPFSISTSNEQQHDKTNKMTYVPSEDSDEPGHPPSLIRVFAVRLKKLWVLSCLLGAQ